MITNTHHIASYPQIMTKQELYNFNTLYQLIVNNAEVYETARQFPANHSLCPLRECNARFTNYNIMILTENCSLQLMDN